LLVQAGGPGGDSGSPRISTGDSMAIQALSATASSPVPRSGGAEAVAGSFALLLLAGVQLIGAYSLFDRTFWQDELHTRALVADPSLYHSFQALASGFDCHPPAYFLLMRVGTMVFGSHSEVAYRSLAFGSVLLASVAIYLLLRPRFSPLVAVASALTIWATPLLPPQALEARPYGVWLATAAWLALMLATGRGPAGHGRLLSLGVLAVLVCTSHYFGIVTWGLLVAVEALGRPRHQRLRWPEWAALALGPIALLCCAELLREQRSALSVATWVAPPPSWLRWTILVGLPAAGLIGLARWRRSGQPPSGERPPDGLTELRTSLGPAFILLGLGLFPLFLFVFSCLFESVLVPRYFLPMVLALPPIVALLLSRLSAKWVLAFAALTVVWNGFLFRAEAEYSRGRDQRLEELIAAIRLLESDVPVVFELPEPLYAVCHYAPDQTRRCFLLDYQTGELIASKYRLLNRDLGRQFTRFYGPPAMLDWEQLRRLERFYIVPAFLFPAYPEPPLADGSRDHYPGYVVRYLPNGLFEARRDEQRAAAEVDEQDESTSGLRWPQGRSRPK